MTEVIPAPKPEAVYVLDYNLYSSAVHNLDFKGPGILTISADGPTYTFAGKPRGLFASKSAKLVFGHDDIVNVTLAGRAVQFKTKLGQSGWKGRPFAFHLRDNSDARAVAELLPKTVDAEFTEARDFTSRLNELHGPQNPWTSPTNIIIALNVAAFVLMGLLGAGWFETESMMPYILYGANNGAATTDGEWWRLLTSMFMHYGLIHLLLNMWALFQAGHFVEKLVGRRPYTLAYLASGIAGGFVSIAWHGDQSWSAGASGAVFGIYGVILGYMLRQKQAMPQSVYRSMMKSTLTFAGYNIVYGLARTGIDNADHFGGLAGGIAFGWLLALPLDNEVRARETGRRLQLGLAALGVIVALGITLTPRFNYRISDVLAWEETNKKFVDPESELIQQNQRSVAGLGRTTDEAAYADWLEKKLIPLYEDWGHSLGALQLAPGKATARARDSLVQIFDLRLRSYRHLLTGLRAHDRQAKDQFMAEDAQVVAEISKFTATLK